MILEIKKKEVDHSMGQNMNHLYQIREVFLRVLDELTYRPII